MAKASKLFIDQLHKSDQFEHYNRVVHIYPFVSKNTFAEGTPGLFYYIMWYYF